MADDWMSQQISDDEPTTSAETPADAVKESKPSPGITPADFEKRIRTLVARDAIEKVDAATVEEHLHTLEDVEILTKAAESTADPTLKDLFANRASELADEPADDDVEPETAAADELPDDEEFAADVLTDADSEEPDAEERAATDSAQLDGETEDDDGLLDADETLDALPTTDADEEFLGGVSPEEAVEMLDAETETDEDDTGTVEEPETTNAAAMLAEETEADIAESEAQADAGQTTSLDTLTSDGSGGVDVKSIAPDVMTVDEAAEKERRWSMLVWADPGLGKTHFSMSTQSPVVVIDTEGKANELAHRFRGSGKYDDPYLFQPSDYDETLDALEKALRILDAYREQEGVTGTLVVDSMSVMWGWAQQKYVDKFYPQAEGPHEVEFKTGFSKGRSDWKVIKNYHNVKFRQVMLDSPYHLVWTAMREDDYEAQFDGERTADKPSGEKENIYKVDEILRIKEGSDGAPIGELQKSGKVMHRYTGLRYPTFDKHRKLVEAIDKAENGQGSIKGVEKRFGVNVTEGNPQYLRREESDE